MSGAIFETWVVYEIYKSYLKIFLYCLLWKKSLLKKEYQIEMHIEKQISKQAALYACHLIYCL
jgi:hypothetical protein